MDIRIPLTAEEASIAEKYIRGIETEAARLPRWRYLLLAMGLFMTTMGIRSMTQSLNQLRYDDSNILEVFDRDAATPTTLTPEQFRQAQTRKMIRLLDLRNQEHAASIIQFAL